MCTGLLRVCRHASSYAIFGVSYFRIKNPGQNVWDFFVPPFPVVQLLCRCNVAEMRQGPLLWAGNAVLWDWAGRDRVYLCGDRHCRAVGPQSGLACKSGQCHVVPAGGRLCGREVYGQTVVSTAAGIMPGCGGKGSAWTDGNLYSRRHNAGLCEG